MPRNRLTDDLASQPILQDNNEERSYQDNELETSEMCCNPRAGSYRFIALIFMCLVGFGEFGIKRQLVSAAYQFCNKGK